MKFTFAGDCMVQERFNLDYVGVKEVKEFISKGDMRFFNLETTLNEMGSCPGSQFSGGSYLRAGKECLDSVMNFGFNITSFNNNHSFDFTMDGFVSTLEILNKENIPYAGTGMDMDDASKAAFLIAENEKASLISVCSSFSASMMAGNTSPCFKGRPGINGLRMRNELIATKEQMEFFKQVAKQSKINIQEDLERAQGYLLPLGENEFSFNGLKIKQGKKAETVLCYNTDDSERIKKSIINAKENSETVIISMHAHQLSDTDSKNNPKVMEDFAHFCIDCGADAFIGHGPHQLRGIQIYKDRPIFYSIGNFIMQLNSIPEAPADFYENYNVNPTEGIEKLLDVRSNGGKRGLMYMKEMFEAIVPFFEIKDGKLLSVELLPIELGYDQTDNTRGLPRIAQNPDFMNRLQDLSTQYGTKILCENGRYFVALD